MGVMHTITKPADNVLWVKVSGKLTKEEYAELVPAWEEMIERHGRLRLLFQMEPEFTGWEPLAAWDDAKFSVSHRNDIEKVALVGAKKWNEIVAKVGKLLVNSEVKFFEEADAALDWVKS